MKKKTTINVLSAVLAYIGSRTLFATFDFRYDLFSEPFDIGKLLIDLGVFAVVYLVAFLALNKLMATKPKAGESSEH